MNDEKEVLSRIVGRAVRRWKERVNSRMNEVDEQLLSLVYQTEEESEVRSDRCWTCLSKEDPKDIEAHHPSCKNRMGEPYDYRTVPLCRNNSKSNNNCHGLATSRGRGWDVGLSSDNPSSELRLERLLRGICDLLDIRAERTGDSTLHMLKDELTEDIRKLSEKRHKDEEAEHG